MDANKTMQLIALVKKNPPLWDKESPGYKDSKAKTQAFEAIGAAIKPPVTGTEAATRFKSLRDNLGKEYKKVQNSMKIPSGSSGSIKVYEPKWAYYSEMLFVKNYIHPRETKSNMNLNVEQTEQSLSTTPDPVIVELPAWLTLPKGFMEPTHPKQVSSEPEFLSGLMDHDPMKIPLQSQKQSADSDISQLGDFRNDSTGQKIPSKPSTPHQKSLHKNSQNDQFRSMEDSSDEDTSYSSQAQKFIKLELQNNRQIKHTTPPLDPFAIKKNQKQDQWGAELAQAAAKTAKVLEKFTCQSEKKVDSSLEDMQRATAIIPYSLLFVPEKLRVKCIREMLQVIERYQEESQLDP